MRIILHIGMQKTGTTSLQKWFADNEEEVERLGWRCITNPFAIMRFHEAVYSPSQVKAAVDRAKADGLDALMFSAEGLSTFSAAHLRDIVELFVGNSVEIVLCLRHWSGFLPSRWSQGCAWGDSQSFPAYLSDLTRLRETHIDACYPLIIDRVLHCNPNRLSVISYNNAISQNALLTTFLDTIDFPHLASHTDNLSRANAKRGLELVELARLFSGVVRERKGGSMNPFFESNLASIPLEGALIHIPLVNAIRRHSPDLIDQLQTHLAADIVEDWQANSQDELLDWESAAHVAAEPYLVNPIEGRLFASVETSSEAYSRLDVGVLSEAIRRRMMSALEDARTKSSN